MKRYILSIMCCMATIILFAQYPGYPDCERITDFSPTISRWGAAYQPVANELQCWEIDLGVQGHTKITYNIDLELVNGMDQIIIYELDDNFQTTRMMRSFFACTTSGTLITNSTTGKIKIEYWGYYGNCEGLYNGFQIRVEQATCCDLVNHDHYVLGKLGVGTTQPTYDLDVAGTIRANEIIVNTTGADFVFADDYQLRPLSEVKAFITENKHLPEIKSAQEMQENGVGVNELQTQLLQKIEELTLYILQQEERIKALEAELNK